ncbi:MAG: hypothetical protein WCF85_21745, partial [Rhodospirillaceae bacterium]
MAEAHHCNNALFKYVRSHVDGSKVFAKTGVDIMSAIDRNNPAWDRRYREITLSGMFEEVERRRNATLNSKSAEGAASFGVLAKPATEPKAWFWPQPPVADGGVVTAAVEQRRRERRQEISDRPTPALLADRKATIEKIASLKAEGKTVTAAGYEQALPVIADALKAR